MSVMDTPDLGQDYRDPPAPSPAAPDPRLGAVHQIRAGAYGPPAPEAPADPRLAGVRQIRASLSPVSLSPSGGAGSTQPAPLSQRGGAVAPGVGVAPQGAAPFIRSPAPNPAHPLAAFDPDTDPVTIKKRQRAQAEADGAAMGPPAPGPDLGPAPQTVAARDTPEIAQARAREAAASAKLSNANFELNLAASGGFGGDGPMVPSGELRKAAEAAEKEWHDASQHLLEMTRAGRILEMQASPTYQGIGPTPDAQDHPGFVPSLAREAVLGLAGTAAREFLPDSLIDRMEMSKPADTLPGKVGGFLGGTAAGFVPGPPANNLFLIAPYARGALEAASAAGAVVAPGVKNIAQRGLEALGAHVEQRLGRTAAQAVQHAVSGGSVGGTLEAVQHAGTEDWDKDPWGAMGRTMKAGAEGAAKWAAIAGGHTAIARGLTGATAREDAAGAVAEVKRNISGWSDAQVDDFAKNLVTDPNIPHAVKYDLSGVVDAERAARANAGREGVRVRPEQGPAAPPAPGQQPPGTEQSQPAQPPPAPQTPPGQARPQIAPAPTIVPEMPAPAPSRGMDQVPPTAPVQPTWAGEFAGRGEKRQQTPDEPPPLTTRDLGAGTEGARAAGGISSKVASVGLKPAFIDRATGKVYPSVYPANYANEGDPERPAPVHIMDGLPPELVVESTPGEKEWESPHVRAVKGTVQAGFVDSTGRFFTREEAAQIAASSLPAPKPPPVDAVDGSDSKTDMTSQAGVSPVNAKVPSDPSQPDPDSMDRDALMAELAANGIQIIGTKSVKRAPRSKMLESVKKIRALAAQTPTAKPAGQAGDISVTKIASEPRARGTVADLYEIKSGGVTAKAAVFSRPDGTLVLNISAAEGGAGKFGVGTVLKLRQKLRELYPSAKRIEGERVGSTGGKVGRDVDITLPPKDPARMSKQALRDEIKASADLDGVDEMGRADLEDAVRTLRGHLAQQPTIQGDAETPDQGGRGGAGGVGGRTPAVPVAETDGGGAGPAGPRTPARQLTEAERAAGLRRPSPGEFSRADIERRLLKSHENTGLAPSHEISDRDASEALGTDELSTAFPGPLPGEVRDWIDKDPKRRRMFQANMPGGTGPDVMAALGSERYPERVEQLVGGREGRVRRAVDFARSQGDNDPEAKFLAFLHDNLPASESYPRKKGEAPKEYRARLSREKAANTREYDTLENPATLPDGARLSIAGKAFAVIHENGEPILTEQFDDDPDAPVSEDAGYRVYLAALGSLPVDRGTLELPETKAEPKTAATVRQLHGAPNLLGEPMRQEPLTGHQPNMFGAAPMKGHAIQTPAAVDVHAKEGEDAKIAAKFDESATPMFGDEEKAPKPTGDFSSLLNAIQEKHRDAFPPGDRIGEIAAESSDESLLAAYKWARGQHSSVERFIGGPVANELASRGIKPKTYEEINALPLPKNPPRGRDQFTGAANGAPLEGEGKGTEAQTARGESPEPGENKAIPDKPYTLAEHPALAKRIAAGDISAEELKAAFARLLASRDAIRDELKQKTLKQLAPGGTGWLTKPKVIDRIIDRMMQRFSVGDSFTWSPMQEKYADALARVVNATTDADIARAAGKGPKEEAPSPAGKPAAGSEPAAPTAPSEPGDTPTEAKPEPADTETAPAASDTPTPTAERAALIERIVKAAQNPTPPIGEIFELKGTDGKWYRPNGVPIGVRTTGERRSVGWAVMNDSGGFVGRSAPTREAKEAEIRATQESADQDFREALRGMDDERLKSQEDYWIKRHERKESAKAAAADIRAKESKPSVTKGPDATGPSDTGTLPSTLAPPAGLTPATGDVLAAHGIRIKATTTKNGKPVWEVTGETYPHRDTIKALGGKWYQPKKSWSFYGTDPTSALTQRLGGQPAGSGSTTVPGGARRPAGEASPSVAGNRDDAGHGGDRPRDLAREQARLREDARADERRAGGDYANAVSARTQELIRLGSKAGIPADVLNTQIEDIGMAAVAFGSGKPIFLLNNKPGAGKTYVLGGIIRELQERGVQKLVWITNNQDLISQIKSDLAAYGLTAVKFHTYAELSDGPGGIDADGAAVLFDEAHNVKDPATKRGSTAQKMMAGAKFVVFSSATAAENPVQYRYLSATGVFKPAGGFVSWAQTYGAQTKKIKKWQQRQGKVATEEDVYWISTKQSKEDAKAAREWFNRQGIMTQRDIKLNPELTESRFRKVAADPKMVDLYNRLQDAYAEALSGFMDEDGKPLPGPSYRMISAHGVNLGKRVLEAAKIDAAIDRGRAAIAEGRKVVFFVETKADREVGRFRMSNAGPKSRTYSSQEVLDMMREWRVAKGFDDRNAPPPPFAQFIESIASAMRNHGIDEKLPSVPDLLAEAFKGNVSEYHGGQTDAENTRQLGLWRKGTNKAMIATMAKGGTGLSLHDKEGDQPTTQINLTLPWTATKVEQVGGRTARYGLASKAVMEWLFSDAIPFEQRLASKVGQRMRDMGATVSGVDMPSAEALADWDFEDNYDAKQDQARDRKAAPVDPVKDLYRRAEGLERGRQQLPDKDLDYFATPYPLAALMQRVAGIQPGESVLEPSAGEGNLIRLLPEGVPVTAIEMSPRRAGELRKMGRQSLTVDGGDFLDRLPPPEKGPHKDLDRHGVVLMNPPFSRAAGVGSQDVAHVQHAFKFLKDGGRLVAVMGEGAFFRDNKVDVAFRQWLDDVGATVVRLPEQTFKKSGTGVAARLVIIDKGSGLGGEIDLRKGSPEWREVEGLLPKRPGTSGGDTKPRGGPLSRPGMAATPAELARGAAETWREIRKLLATSTISPEAKAAHLHMREMQGKLARTRATLESTFRDIFKHFERMPKADALKVIDDIEHGRPLADPVAASWAPVRRRIYDDLIREVRRVDKNALRALITDYFPHVWKDPKKAATVFGQIMSKRPLEGGKGFLKKRTIPTVKDGIAAGLTPVSYNPVELDLIKMVEMKKFVLARQLLKQGKKGGWAKFIKATERTPTGWSVPKDRMFTVYGPRPAPGTTPHVGLNLIGHYAMPDDAAYVLDQALAPGLKQYAAYRGFRALNNLINQATLGVSGFHATFETVNATVGQLAHAIQRGAAGKPIEAAFEALKVPAAVALDLKRGGDLLRAYVDPGSQGKEVERVMRALVMGGARGTQDAAYAGSVTRNMMRAFREGMAGGVGAKAWGAVGGLSRTPFAAVEQIARPTFEYMVPRLKLAAGFQMMEAWLRDHPKAKEAEVRAAAAGIWNSVENRHGQMAYDNLAMNKIAKDLMMVLVGRPGWQIGTVRELAGGAYDIPAGAYRAATGKGPAVSPRMAYLLALPLVVGAAGALINYLFTGEYPKDTADYFMPRTGGKNSDGSPRRVMLPSYLKDAAHAATHPVDWAQSKIAPAVQMVAALLENKDFSGVSIMHPGDSLLARLKEGGAFVGKSFLPYSVTNLQRSRENKAPAGEQVASFVGINPPPKYLSGSPGKKWAEFHGWMEDRARIIRGGKTFAERTSLMREALQAIRDSETVLSDRARKLKMFETEMKRRKVLAGQR